MIRRIMLSTVLCLTGLSYAQAEITLEKLDPAIAKALKPYEVPRVLVGTISADKPDKFQKMINSAFEQKIIESSLQVIERDRSQRLLKEMKIKQLLQKGKAYKGQNFADFLLLWDFSSQNVTAEYAIRASKINIMSKLEGDTAQPRCKYTAQVQGHAKIYRLPSLAPLNSIILKGDHDVTRLNRPQECPHDKKEEVDWLSEASKDAVDDSRIGFQPYFTPYGYLIDIKETKKNLFVRVNLGKINNLKKGIKVYIRHPVFIKDVFDPSKKTLEFEKIAKGIVTDDITERTAWIVIKSIKPGARLYEKDKVEILRKKPLF